MSKFGSSPHKLIIGEKPSVAGAIATVVGANTKTSTYYEGNGYIVSWCYGHLIGLAMPDEYGEQWKGNWSFDQLPMIPERYKMKIKDDARTQYNALKSLMNDSTIDEIICATDADREGECIFRYVYNMSGSKKPVKRLWVSSLEETAIQDGLRKMKPMSEYNNLFSAGYSRAKSDWLVGMNGSRLFSVRYKNKLNIGRVQTPTLAMIVKRDYEVANFVKQKYFTVDINCGFKAVSDRIDDENTAKSLAEKVNGHNAAVTSLKKEIKTVNPPKLYDLTTLQREANKQFGYTAQQTLDALQKLYEAKLATYPRTDSQYLSDDMEDTALKVIDIVFTTFKQFGTPTTTPNIKRCINNSKVTGHHAILPTENIATANIDELPDAQRNILMLISAKLVLATSAPHKYEAVKVEVVADNDRTIFHANGKKVIEMGWKLLEQNVKNALRNNNTDKEEKSEEQLLPELYEGQKFENIIAVTSEHWTSPPKPYTEDTLLSAMEHAGQENFDDDTEKKGIGTPATRAGTIEGLFNNGYIERNKNQITSTEKGRNLISVVPEEVKSPKMTAEWENQLLQVERGHISVNDFMNGIISFVKEICAKYGQLDETGIFKKENAVSESYNCPKCKNAIKKGKFGFYCTGKCGMNLTKVYGKELTETQLKNLLSGKQISYTSNGKKTIVLPNVVESNYNGKTYYQWTTKR